MKRIMEWFDELEDKVRAWLARRPFLYGLTAGVGAVFFFRGVWLLADEVWWMTGTVTMALAIFILGITGTLVSHFVSDKEIISGLKREKKWEETIGKRGEKKKKEEDGLAKINKEIREIKNSLKKLESRK